MAVDDIDNLRHEIPEVFEDRPLPPGWEADWLVIPAPSIEKALPPAFGELQDMLIPEDEREAGRLFHEDAMPAATAMAPPESWLPPIDDNFPGGPSYSWPQSSYPPPNALAFYLPFHYYHHLIPPSWWGVYLTVEGVSELSRLIWRRAAGKLTKIEALFAGQLFLYGQKVYHHKVECFATRLEITHRVPLYKEGFWRFYQQDPHKVEDTLATVHGYDLARRAFHRAKEKQQAVVEALQGYIEGCPPPYKWAEVFLTPKGFRRSAFKNAESSFAEDNHREALSRFPHKGAKIWLTFPYAFSGISRITSKVNYIINRSSPLYQRLGLHLQYPPP